MELITICYSLVISHYCTIDYIYKPLPARWSHSHVCRAIVAESLSCMAGHWISQISARPVSAIHRFAAIDMWRVINRVIILIIIRIV